jgi:diguanylate cyclase (GGDEF)-like protein
MRPRPSTRPHVLARARLAANSGRIVGGRLSGEAGTQPAPMPWATPCLLRTNTDHLTTTASRVSAAGAEGILMGLVSMRRVISVLAAIVVLIAGALYATADIQRNAALLGARQQVAAQGMLTAMLDQETGSRGFVETRQKAFLVPWDAGTSAFTASLAALRSLEVGNVGLERLLDDQAQRADRWHAEVQAAISRFDQTGRPPSVAEALRDKTVMDGFRASHDALDALLATQRSRQLTVATTVVIGVTIALVLLLAAIGLLARRLVRREDARQRAQDELHELLHASEFEGESRLLLIRHVERLVPQAGAIVLNRNASDDQLEVTRGINADESRLPIADVETLRPRSCMAVRFSRSYDRHPGDDGLSSCDICGALPVASACEPLLVGGQVIGSVLVASSKPISSERRLRLSECVGQAAPIIANHRNLALAEMHALSDTLTGLPNRRAAEETLKRTAAFADRSLAPLVAVMIDLDHFKTLNDRHGHETGDKALALVARIIRSTIRESDFASRFGGEEFLVLLPNTDRATGLLVAEKLRVEIGHAELAGVAAISASLGVSVMPADATTADGLLRNADRALYVAKESGRNRVHSFSSAAAGNEHPQPTPPGDAITTPAPPSHARTRQPGQRPQSPVALSVSSESGRSSGFDETPGVGASRHGVTP